MSQKSIQFKFHVNRKDFSLDVDASIPGDGVTAFFGRSGSGKTTLLRCVAGLEKSRSAYLSVNDAIWHDSVRKIYIPTHRREIGYVFQEGALFPNMSVKKNLLYGYRRTPASGRNLEFKEIIDLLGIGHLLDRTPGSLSGGEKQRVAIGRALLSHPRLLLMDEPMASLDHAHKREILPYLEELRESVEIPILYVTHDRDEMIRVASHIVLIDEGRIIAQGTDSDILTRVDLPIAREDEAAAFIEAKVVAHDEEFFLTKLGFAGGELYVNWMDRAIDSPVRVRIMAKEVGLSLERPASCSSLNIIPAKIDDMKEHGRGRLIIRLNIAGEPILARITQKSRYQLGINVGDNVFAEIKSVALVS